MIVSINLLISGLYDNAASNSDYTASNDRIISEMVIFWVIGPGDAGNKTP